jgi:uncharacterized protein YhfF
MLLPGVVLPADLAYGGLVSALGPDVESILKDLEVYREDAPPPDYSLETEVAGILREADDRGWQRFHLVGYSGGGAAALAFAARWPARLLSLALLEPAWGGNWGWSPEHARLWARAGELEQLPPDELMPAFMRLQVRPEVSLPPPPPGPQPPWMSQRPAGIRAIMRTFKSYDLDRESLAAFAHPVYFALGGMSNPDQYGELAQRLGQVFGDFTLEVFAERHHFDPPHRVEPERLARSLREFWAIADLPTFEFAFPGPLRDKLVAAVLDGTKTATAGLLQGYEIDSESLPVVGTRAAVVDSAGRRVAVIEVTDVRVSRLGDVDVEHARAEGEGDESVAAWRAGHENYWHGADYRGWLRDPTFTVDDDTRVVLERFRLVALR